MVRLDDTFALICCKNHAFVFFPKAKNHTIDKDAIADVQSFCEVINGIGLESSQTALLTLDMPLDGNV